MKFTRGDLLCVLIVGVLALCLLIPMSIALAQSNNKTLCLNNLRGLGQVLEIYVSKFGGHVNYPPGDTAKTLLATLRGVPNPQEAVTKGIEEIYTCPVFGQTLPFIGSNQAGIDYASYDGTGPDATWPGSRLTAGAPPNLAIAADPQENHGGHDDGNFLYFQGNVEARRWDDFSREAYGAKNLSGATHSFP